MAESRIERRQREVSTLDSYTAPKAIARLPRTVVFNTGILSLSGHPLHPHNPVSETFILKMALTLSSLLGKGMEVIMVYMKFYPAQFSDLTRR